jgi:hypothetical protein
MTLLNLIRTSSFKWIQEPGKDKDGWSQKIMHGHWGQWHQGFDFPLGVFKGLSATELSLYRNTGLLITDLFFKRHQKPRGCICVCVCKRKILIFKYGLNLFFLILQTKCLYAANTTPQPDGLLLRAQVQIVQNTYIWQTIVWKEEK